MGNDFDDIKRQQEIEDYKEFVRDYNKEFKKVNYAARRTSVSAAIGITCLVVFIGLCGVAYTRTIGKAQTNAEREVFKSTVAYTEQAASFLAKSYKEYNDAETDADKKTIKEYVVMRYPNLDIGSIDNVTLKQFYNDCLK